MAPHWSWVLAVLVVMAGGLSRPGSAAPETDFRRAFPIVEPDSGHTKLRLAKEGLEAIERITNPIASIAVIGPYRSGKSFLLNQLLSLSCDEGFGVGHMRDTKTKGIWIWGTPLEVVIDGVKTSVLYLDTEGFESVGKSSVYDDRIFALATVMSSVLIYNLAETIREADISRLSFAVELAEEFYGRVKGQDVVFEPAKLLWLIQRDFLQGKSVQEMVNDALREVPNNSGDKNIDQVNQIRKSLAVMGDNSTAFSLPQGYSSTKRHFIQIVGAFQQHPVCVPRPGLCMVSFDLRQPEVLSIHKAVLMPQKITDGVFSLVSGALCKPYLCHIS